MTNGLIYKRESKGKERVRDYIFMHFKEEVFLQDVLLNQITMNVLPPKKALCHKRIIIICATNPLITFYFVCYKIVRLEPLNNLIIVSIDRPQHIFFRYSRDTNT